MLGMYLPVKVAHPPVVMERRSGGGSDPARRTTLMWPTRPIVKSPCNLAYPSDIIFARDAVPHHLDQEYVAFTANFCSRTGIGLPAARL